MSSLSGKSRSILNEKSKRIQGKDAFSMNVDAAKAVAMAIQSTFGPKGMSKMLVDGLGDISVTNDGAKILEELEIEHPSARMVKEMAKTIKKNIGDGSTSSVIFLGELVSRAQEMIASGLSPAHIYEGYSFALKKSHEILDKISSKVDLKNREQIRQCALTALNCKISQQAPIFADIVVDAIDYIKNVKGSSLKIDIDNIQIIKKHGDNAENSTLIRGIVVDKEVISSNMPKTLENAKIVLIDAALEIVKTEYSSEIKISNPTEIDSFLDKEMDIIRQLTDKIHAAGANVVFCQKGVDETAQNFLGKNGIMAIRRVKHSDMVKLSLATGASIITQVKSMTAKDLGTVGRISERKIGKDYMIFVEECPDPHAITIMIRGTTEHIVDELERAIKNGLGVVKALYESPLMVPGGGSVETELSKQLSQIATTVGGKKQIAIEHFAQALEIIPKTIINNSGRDALDVLTELRAKTDYAKNQIAVFNAFTGQLSDNKSDSLWDATAVKKHILTMATELAVVFIRIDDIIKGHSRKVGK
jgi:thermosome